MDNASICVVSGCANEIPEKSKTGLCKRCYARQYMRKRRQDSEYRQKQYELTKAWRRKNIEYCRQKRKETYLANREKELEESKTYQKENWEQVKAKKYEWNQRNREKYLEIKRAEKKRNAERYRQWFRDKFANDPEFRDKQSAAIKKFYSNPKNKRKKAEYLHRWRSDNLNRHAANQSRRRAKKLKATPLWANEKKILEKYTLAQKLTESTGVLHHVDHIIPLQGKVVCGLHVENNLQVITATENLSKSNCMIEEV